MDLENFLSSAYQTKKFEEFITDIFYGFESEETSLIDDDLSESEKEHIKFYRYLGKVALDDDSEIGFFEFVSTSPNIENKRVGYSNILKKLAKEYMLDGAIASFYHPQSSAWRLSFVGFEYDGSKAIVTNLKRYTYVLGVDIAVKTPLAQLKKLKHPQYEEIEEAFSVERVSKEFFNKYRELYGKIVNNESVIAQIFDEKEREKFSKNLLGRIVFLYFLQKKQWLGIEKNGSWHSGSKKFMRELFNNYIGNNFYLDILYPLFFEALNTKRDDDYFEPLQCKIPFLNGGLFDSDEIDKKSKAILLDNTMFEKVFNLFDSYNFTVIEDIPHDSEVAIDPEMLGRVFENLLEENYRKGHGAYYTPREIVHYMCQQSLIEYLANDFEKEEIERLILHAITDNSYISLNADKIDKKLRAIKVLDPAIGSGAFPMGLLHEIVQALVHLSKSLNTPSKIYELKKEVIENCIHGIDIDESAVDIAKLRFWLSLVVDATEPEPLPNLFFKIMQGNSLIETIDGIDPIPTDTSEPKTKKQQKTLTSPIRQAWDFDKIDVQDHIIVLTKKLHQFFKCSEKSKKESIQKEIFTTIRLILEQRVDELENQIRTLQNTLAIEQRKIKTPSVERKIKKLTDEIFQKDLTVSKIIALKEKPIGREMFMYKLWFGEVLKKGGFDVVIANPPYIKEYTDKSVFDGLRDSACYQGKMDIWYLFGCKGIDLLKRESGILTYIATNNWISNAGASKFRNKVLDDTKILEFIDFGDYKVFDTAGVQTMIMTLKQTTENKKYDTKYSRVLNSNLSKNELESFLIKELKKGVNFFEASLVKKDLVNKNINFLKKNIAILLDKVYRKRNFILKDDEVAQGIVAPQDFINKKSRDTLNSSYEVGDGIFNLSDKEVNNLELTEKEFFLIKPFYTSEQLHRYYGDSKNNTWIIYADSSFKHKKNIKPFPNIKKHLDNFKMVITSDNKPYGLHRAREERFFKGEKIISLRKCSNKPTFTYTNYDCYVSQTYFVIKTEDINLKYLTSIFNSKIIEFWLRYKGQMQGSNYQVDKRPLMSIPIKKIQNTKPFEIIVDYITALKKDNLKENKLKSDFFERLIDVMVYEIYFEKEIKKEGYGVLNILKDELIENAKLEQIKELYAKWSDREHKIAYNVSFINSIEPIKTIEESI